MKPDKSVERILKRHGLLDTLDALARVCLLRGEDYGKAGKKARLQPFQLAGYECSTIWHRYARAIRKLTGELRHDEPDADPVRREKRSEAQA